MPMDPSSITAEKSLWVIWTQARRIRRNRFNRWCVRVTLGVMVVYALISVQSAHATAEMVRGWAGVGLGFAATILGFLVAGFTIFATLSKPSLLAAMAETSHDESGLSYLKYNFFIFFETFGWYLGFSALCIIILVFGAAGGAATQLAGTLPSSWQPVVVQVLSRTCAVILGSWFILLCCELKSFIFNLYTVVMTSIRWTLEFPDQTDH